MRFLALTRGTLPQNRSSRRSVSCAELRYNQNMESTVHEKPLETVEHAARAHGEFSALIAGCGVYALPGRALIELTSDDRVRWLNGMVTNNVRDLAAGHGVYAFLLNPQGHILGDLYAYNRGESLHVETERSQLDRILATFDRYIIMDDVEVKNISEEVSVLGIAGPRACEVLQKAQFEISHLAPLQFRGISWQGAPLTLVRGDNPAVQSFELYLTPATASVARDALAAAGAQVVGEEALELLRIASGVPRYGRDIRERDLPQETEQARALNFSKGCYVGQEIVERIRSRGAVHRMFTGFKVEGSLPASGSKIQSEGKDVGEITSSASLPIGGEFKAALGYIRREMAAKSSHLVAGESRLRIAEVPFAEVCRVAS